MRFLGNNYTGAHRDVNKIATILRKHVPEDLVEKYIRVMTVGCPAKFNYETTRENAFHYWKQGNNPSIQRKLAQVMSTMNKEERNNFVIALPGWTWRYVPNLFFTPQHILEKAGKKDRQIFDAAFRHNADSISVNMMTSTSEGVELECKFGDVLQRLLTRIWNLRITYPTRDIVLHANDVKSCFRQLKHHPDVMGAFSYVINDILFLQCGLTFGSDFSPASWEVLRRIAEQLAEALFDDKSLRNKHRQYLDQLNWQRSLGSKKAKFTPAKADSHNQGVRKADGTDANTPHAFFVDDDVYAELFDVERVEQAIAASIEAIFILLGESDLAHRQDPISFDKLIETTINYLNRILGREINTRTMMIRTPIEFVAGTINILDRKWSKHNFTFALPDLESLVGRLGHIADTAPWLRYIMSQMYTSIAAVLKDSESHLYTTRRDFRALMKTAKTAVSPEASSEEADRHERHKTYAQSQTAKLVHHSRKRYKFNRTLRWELRLIRQALSSSWISHWRPIAHMVDREPSGTAWSDSCLYAAGGFSFDMKFWWHLDVAL